MTIRKTHEWQEFMEGYDRCMHCGLLRKPENIRLGWKVINQNKYYARNRVGHRAKDFSCNSRYVEAANDLGEQPQLGEKHGH